MFKARRATFKAVLAASLIGVLSGCVQQPVVTLGAFPVSEYEALPKEGTGVVTGQLFLRTVGGDVKYGAGSEVMLTPVTSYSRRIQAAPSNATARDLDYRLNEYTRRTQADGEGRFTFKSVPAGNYYVGGQVIWHRPSRLGPLPEGGFVMKEVTVAEGQESSVMVTR